MWSFSLEFWNGLCRSRMDIIIAALMATNSNAEPIANASNSLTSSETKAFPALPCIWNLEKVYLPVHGLNVNGVDYPSESIWSIRAPHKLCNSHGGEFWQPNGGLIKAFFVPALVVEPVVVITFSAVETSFWIVYSWVGGWVQTSGDVSDWKATRALAEEYLIFKQQPCVKVTFVTSSLWLDTNPVQALSSRTSAATILSTRHTYMLTTRWSLCSTNATLILLCQTWQTTAHGNLHAQLNDIKLAVAESICCP